ncbi:MAG: glycine cleavage T C-terminal barrel domain-containing protein, partial [Pseudomonadota bacterium]
NYGTDTDDATNPFEVRLGRFIDLDLEDDVIGIRALRRIKAAGVRRHQLGIILEGPAEAEDQSIWLEIEAAGRMVGHMTHKAWSYRLGRMIGYALVSADIPPGAEVTVHRGTDRLAGRLVSLPFKL